MHVYIIYGVITTLHVTNLLSQHGLRAINISYSDSLYNMGEGGV